jgi:hypothetical protein
MPFLLMCSTMTCIYSIGLKDLAESPIRISQPEIDEIVKRTLIEFISGLIDNVFDNLGSKLLTPDTSTSAVLQFSLDPSDVIRAGLSRFADERQKIAVAELKRYVSDLAAKLDPFERVCN